MIGWRQERQTGILISKISEQLDEAGVQITVEQLTDGALRSFESPRFIQKLRRSIARDYALHLHRGLTIEVNGASVSGWAIELLQGGEFTPMRATFTEQIEDEDVHVEILAGMSAPPPDTDSPTEPGMALKLPCIQTRAASCSLSRYQRPKAVI